MNGCGQVSTSDTLFYNSWFSGIKIVEEAYAEETEYCGPTNKIHKAFFLTLLEILLKYLPGSSPIVMENKSIITGRGTLMEIGYKLKD